jgi:D-glycerate 3-kinase
MPLCRYDKSAYSGRGDRAPPSAWPSVKGPVEVVLFEGWMSGFAPLAEDAQVRVPVMMGCREYSTV